jgi:hypothetical protein
MAIKTAYLDGIALWTPLLPGWDVAAPVLRGDAPPPEKVAARPSPAMLAPTERRRAPDTVAIALEVGARACECAGIDPKAVASVFASTHGDLAINDYMSDTLAREPHLLSPIRFHNSVHNAAAGYWSIGTGSMQPYTALTAWGDTFGEGLLEALVQADTGGRPVLLVAYDVEARGPLAAMQPSRGIVGVALVVAPRAGPSSVAKIQWAAVHGTGRTAPLARNKEFLAGNAMATCLPLVETVAMSVDRTVRLGLGPNILLEMEFEFTRGKDGT